MKEDNIIALMKKHNFIYYLPDLDDKTDDKDSYWYNTLPVYNFHSFINRIKDVSDGFNIIVVYKGSMAYVPIQDIDHALRALLLGDDR